MAENTFFFLNKIDGLRDPVRSTRWRLLIPQSVFKASGIKVTVGKDFGDQGVAGTDEFALHVKTCSFPDFTIKEDMHNYMGFQSAFPVNAQLWADLPFETILLEDMRAYEAMLAWQQACLNTGVLVGEDKQEDRMTATTGLELGLGYNKDAGLVNVLRNSDVKVELYTWMNGQVMVELKLINAYPKTVAGPKAFTYGTDAKLQKFTFTLHCDRWTVRTFDTKSASLV